MWNQLIILSLGIVTSHEPIIILTYLATPFLTKIIQLSYNIFLCVLKVTIKRSRSPSPTTPYQGSSLAYSYKGHNPNAASIVPVTQQQPSEFFNITLSICIYEISNIVSYMSYVYILYGMCSIFIVAD